MSNDRAGATNTLTKICKEEMTMLELGKKGKDKVTGFEGVITGHAKYLYGCDLYALTPTVDKDGKICETNWFDEGRIEVIGDGIKAEDVRAEKNGAGSPPKSATDIPRR
jgi:hypothetical protein